MIVLIIAFPAICIIINSGIQQRRDSINNAKIETQKLAEAIVSEQKNLISSARQLFIALSQLPEVTTQNQIKTQTILTEILLGITNITTYFPIFSPNPIYTPDKSHQQLLS